MASVREQLEQLNQQIKEIAGLYREAIGRAAISENEFWIWYSLVVLGGECTQQDICSAWSISKQTVNTIVGRMVRRGYVYLEAVPGTRNCKHICLTEAGRQYGETICHPVSEAEERAFQRLSAEERSAFASGLGKYIVGLQEELSRLEAAERPVEDRLRERKLFARRRPKVARRMGGD